MTLLVTSVVASVEALGGYFAGSLALVSDAAHLWLDSLALLASFVALRIAGKGPSRRFPWGLAGVEVVAALVNGLLLLAAAAAIAQAAWLRSGSIYSVEGDVMLLAAAFGLVANFACLALLHGHQHSLTMRGAFLHVVGDVANGLGVIAAALLVKATGNVYFDCYASLVIALVVAATSVPLFVEAGRRLLQASPNPSGDAALAAAIDRLPVVARLKALRPWQLGQDNMAVLVRVEAAAGADVRVVRAALTRLVHEHYPQADVVLDICL